MLDAPLIDALALLRAVRVSEDTFRALLIPMTELERLDALMAITVIAARAIEKTEPVDDYIDRMSAGIGANPE